MKHIIKSAILAAAALLAAGCHEKFPNPSYVIGVIEDDFTRTAYTPEANMLKGSWVAGDEITLMTANGTIQDETDHVPFAYLMASDTGRMVSFMQMDESFNISSPYIAYYPSYLFAQELPDVQIYKADGPYEVPMMAKSPTMYLEFKPICGLMEIKLSTALENVKVKSLDLRADKPLSGGFYVNDDYEAIAQGFAENGLKLDCKAGVPLGKEPVSFWVSVPPGEYSRLTIKMTATDGRTQTFSLKEGTVVKIERARITTCPIEMEGVITPETDTAYLPTGQEFNIALKRIARPDLPANEMETAFVDSTIIRIVFVKGDKNASGTPIGTSEVPVYGSFNASTGVMTVSTAAAHLHTSSDCCCMFRYMAALETVSFENLETEGVADMSYIFNHCHNLKTVDFTGINTSQVRTLDNAFSYCRQLEALDLSGFDTQSVRNMRSLFNHCSVIKELDLRSFKTEQCTIMTYMFYYCESLEELDISSFDLKSVPGANLIYHFFVTPALKTVRTGSAYIPNDREPASSYCTNSTTSYSLRMGSKNNGVTFITTQAVADWLATTNLRWIKSGYSGKTPIPVYFKDSATGADLTVTWAAN